MTVVGAGKLNLHPCTEAEEAQNLQVLNTFITTVTNTLNEDAFTVKCSTNDTQDDFLLASLTTTGARDPDADPLIGAEIANPGADETVTLFFKSNLVPGFNLSGTYVFAIVDGVATFIDETTIGGGGGGGSDDKTVKVTGTDTTSGYLYASMEDTGTYSATTDVLVMAMVMHGGADEKLRQFVRIDSSLATKVFNQITFDGATWNSGTLTLTIDFEDGEKYRLAHATVFTDSAAASTTVTVTGVHELANGLRPVATDGDTLVATKWQNILNGVSLPYPAYKSGDHVLLISTRNGTGTATDWFVLPVASKGEDGTSGAYSCSIDGEISAGSASSRTAGTGQIYGTDAGDGSVVDLGNHFVHNPFQMTAKGDCSVERVFLGRTDDELDDTKDIYLIMGLRPTVECSSHDLGTGVTGVTCGADGIEVTTGSLGTITVIDTVAGYGCH